MRPKGGPRGGLTRRSVLASCLVALLAMGTYALLFTVIFDLRSATKVSAHSGAVLASSNRLERLVTDLESGVRGFIITNDGDSLRQWEAARGELPDESASLERLAAGSGADQEQRARRIVQDSEAYIREYSAPLVADIRANPRSQRSVTTIEEGERRLTLIRAQFDRFQQIQRGISSSFQERADRDARRATIIATSGAAGALFLIFSFSGYLTRKILRPVRRASRMAWAITAGDLSVRIPETSRDEMGSLEHVFNTMASTLATSQEELRRVVSEQGALRRVATLIARSVSPIEIFSTVAGELGRFEGAHHTMIIRFAPGNTALSVGHWSAPMFPHLKPPFDGHWPIEKGTCAEAVRGSGKPARVTHDASTSKIGIWTRQHGMHQVIGAPLIVDGNLWGMATILSYDTVPLAADTETRMLEYMELLATAIANAEYRSKLLDSHTRIVAASDAVRRRIECDLRDVTQQRLVSLQHRVRTAISGVPPDQVRLGEQLTRTAQGLSTVQADLQEITRGLHPVALSQSGLRPALKALTQRSRVPVELDIRLDQRLKGHIEVAIYYTVSEALTNVVKYAHATKVRVDLAIEDHSLRLSIRDNGLGGADPALGSGLAGLKDRIEALGGELDMTSPAGRGTSLLITIPIETAQPPHPDTSTPGTRASS